MYVEIQILIVCMRSAYERYSQIYTYIRMFLHVYKCIHVQIHDWNKYQHAYVCTRGGVGVCRRSHSRWLLRTQTHAHMNVHTYIQTYTHTRAHMQTHTQIHRYTVCFEHTNTLCTHTQNLRRSHPHTYTHTLISYTPEKAKARDTCDTPFWLTRCAHEKLSTASESLKHLTRTPCCDGIWRSYSNTQEVEKAHDALDFAFSSSLCERPAQRRRFILWYTCTPSLSHTCSHQNLEMKSADRISSPLHHDVVSS